jgi:hypothetical protein
MKKIYYLILLMMLGVGAMAETINIVVSGKAGGTFHARSMLMHDALVDMGYEVNLINAGNLSKAAQVFTTTSEPVIMPWIDSANLKENLQPTESTFGVLEYTAPIVFCSQKYSSFDAQKIQIGHSASWPDKIFISLSNRLDKPVDAVPYRNSGDLVLAFVSGEIDYIAISMSKLKKLPEGSCFAVTNNAPIENITPMKNVLQGYEYTNIQQHAYWLIKHYDKRVRLLLASAILSPTYKDWIMSKSFVLSSFNFNDLQRSQQGAVNWGLE